MSNHSKNIKLGKLEITVGNLKLGSNTMIFNMCCATDCPSRANGTCKLGDRCYALKAEKVYPKCKPYRDRQAEYWNNTDIDTIIKDFDELLRTKRVRVNGKLTRLYKTIDYFRYNEAGDFGSQDDIEKLHALATYLMETYSIVTYGYTARSDLDFTGVIFSVKGSGYYKVGNNGMTIARHSKQIKTNMANSSEYRETIEGHNLLFKLCPMDCRDCQLCKTEAYNVVFPLH